MSQEKAPAVIVLKFGSSVLRSVDDLPNVVHEIYRWYREGHRVIAVVSAIGNTTETLLEQTRTFSATPEPFAVAELLATGERASAALLGVALDRAGIPARIVSPSEIGLEVEGTPINSHPVAVDILRVRELLEAVPVLVVPGFFGINTAGRTHCLGRGGSDLTAVFLAVALRARCRLLKDVDGVYESDPADASAHPRRFEQLHYGDALAVAGELIQPKAVAYLRERQACAEVAALAHPYQTLIHGGRTMTAGVASMAPRVDILILGCGTVGFGVYQRLRVLPVPFRVIGVLVRNRAKHEEAGVPPDLLHTGIDSMRALKPTLVIDALPGIGVSADLLTHFLRRGVDVVSANKTVIAEHGAGLTSIASESSATLCYSAAVGGGAPMLEAVSAAKATGPITQITAVLNGTCNYVLDACADGANLSEAIAEAQRLGFAETEPSEDLSGHDTARKLQILVRHAFGTDIYAAPIQYMNESIVEAARDATTSGKRLRQVARAQRRDGMVAVTVGFEPADPGSPFHALSAEWNALMITLASGKIITVRGRGAGRWPTTEAILADTLTIVRGHGGTFRLPQGA